MNPTETMPPTPERERITAPRAPAPRSGPAADGGGSCSSCGGALASDQRYCMNCGHREGEPRLPFAALTPEAATIETVAVTERGALPPRDWTPILALGGLGALALVLVVGVLIGKSSSNNSKQSPQVIRVGSGGTAADAGTGGTSAAAATTAGGTFKSDWPAGKEGYTVELGVLPKAGTGAAAVAKAKADAAKKGAPKVGALDSDTYPSLPGGKFVLFSGVFSSSGDAKKALKGLKAKFPQARVVKVSKKAASAAAIPTGKGEAKVSRKQLQNLENLSGAEYEKRSKKLPKVLVLPGKPPPKNPNKPAGGGGPAQTIG